MPKRKVVLPENPGVLEAIREALKHPRILAPEEAAKRRRPHVLERHEYIVTKRRGKRVYREPGKGGADLPVPPYAWKMLQQQRDFETECAKVDRNLTLMIRNKQRRPRPETEQRHALILETCRLLSEIPPRYRAARVAAMLNMPVRTVRRVLKK